MPCLPKQLVLPFHVRGFYLATLVRGIHSSLPDARRNSMEYPLALSSWDEKEIAAIQSVVQSNMFTMGPKVREFEIAFADYVGSRFCCMVNSGSSANLLAVAALFYCEHPKLKAGDEIIVPAVSWSTTYFPLHQYGLKLKFVDIDLLTLNYSLDALASAVTDDTKAIMIVNLLGNPNDFDVVKSIIAGRGIVLLEDNCESLGAEYNGKQTGTFGIMGTFSTFFSHHMSTMEGGMVVTDDEELYHILLSLRAHGWTRHLPMENKVCKKEDDEFKETFRFVLPGYNLRPLEMSGAIGTEQLRKLPSFLEQRKKNAKIFLDAFSDHPDFLIQREIGTSTWFGFALVVRPGSQRDRTEVILKLKEAGIETRPIVAGNFARNDVMKYIRHEIHGTLENADRIHEQGFFVGNHPIDIEACIETLSRLLS